ncbi:MAG: DUF6503 family protein [Bacteroidota bacterium]
MKIYLTLLLLLVGSTALPAQTFSAAQLLEKSIEYHDPEQKWLTWQAAFTLELEMPTRPNRRSHLQIDNKNGNFKLIVERDSHQIKRSVKQGQCLNLLDNKIPKDTALVKKYQLNCERTYMYRDYYAYLYGLPMKLKDQGTILHETAAEVSFKGNTYWKIKVTYEAAVGDDIWYFYLDKDNYALKAYQFYHDESKNDGEYILLASEQMIDGIKVPKDRTWYYNADDKLLGTDFLVEQQ